MDSELRPMLPVHHWLLACGTGVLTAAAFVAGANYPAASTPVLAGSAGAALVGLMLLRRGWPRLPAATWPMERPVGRPQDQAAQAAHALALESQLEFAPIALFRLHDAPAHGLEAVNANARRLLAPGRVVDVAALRASLTALVAGRRSVIDIDTEHGRERTLAIASALSVEGRPQRLIALM
ncbi:MAG: hypothetical protein ACEQSK_20250, partial [Sphingomonadaceae bacterium]